MGISTDGVDSHRKFREKLGLPFALLADPGGRISGRYDALMPIPGVRLASRKLVLVGRDGVIAYRDDAYEVGDAADWKALMAAVDALPARPAR